ncbi:MAG TPA: ROK family protein [Terriglobales bacterium]|jgi:glucokinase|nr:ROK family protein [Terriglobales bacterium]
MSAHQSQLAIGVDVGGTKIAAGIVRSDGQIVARTRQAMVANGTAAAGFSAVVNAINIVREQAPSEGDPSTIEAIGICSPGPLDPRTGTVLNPPNLPCWRNFPLGESLATRFGLPARVDNDANAAGSAEALWGAGRGYRNVFYVTIGTGIGTAIVLDQKIHHGRTGAAGEGGHLSIDRNGPLCACGKKGCIEAFASGPAIAKRAKAQLRENNKSVLLQITQGKPEDVTSELVGQAAHEGDALSLDVLHKTDDLLAFWLGNIIDLLEPEIIIIGGGVGQMLQSHLPDIQALLRRYCLNQRCAEIPLVPAQFAQDAGIAGAAALCFSSDSMPEQILPR